MTKKETIEAIKVLLDIIEKNNERFFANTDQGLRDKAFKKLCELIDAL